MFLILSIFSVLFLIYLFKSVKNYGWKPFSLFKSHGIPGPEPTAFFGNLVSFKKPRYVLEKEWSNKYGNISGYYMGRTPYLLITDVQMIKAIMSTSFSNFRNRPFDVPTDDFTELFLMNTKDQHWKFLRSIMMTAFSNKKLKEALNLMKVCVRDLLTNISHNAENDKEFCINNYCSSYTMDIIAATGFGIQLNSQQNINHPFVLHANALFKPGFLKYLIALSFVFPFMWRLVNIYIILMGERRHRDFFASVCRDTITFRRNNPEFSAQKDIVQTMLEAQSNLENTKNVNQNNNVIKQYDLSDKLIIAQSTMFLLAGYENTANTIGFLAYQLALNGDIQDRVHEEIKEVIQVKDEITFENLQQLKYLDMCLSEVLRLYPVSPRTNRTVAQEMVIQGWTIPKEATVVFPIYTLHHHPQLWPEPEKFDPDRFSAENSESRQPYSYLPFGGGPRMCMGPKFAQLELKLAIVEILRLYRLLPCERTEIPVELDENFLLAPKNGIWLKVEKRKDK